MVARKSSKAMMGSMSSMKDNKGCWGGMCAKCHGGKTLVLGILVLLNALWGFLEWGSFIGIILILAGLMKIAMPTCGHC